MLQKTKNGINFSLQKKQQQLTKNLKSKILTPNFSTMITTIKHKKKAPKVSKIDPQLYALLHANEEFKKLGYIYAVTKNKYAEGEIITITTSRLKAQRKCFTKSKKTRKAYYTKFVFDSTIPADLLKSITMEISTGK